MKIKGKVKAVSGPSEYEGVMQIGFVLEEDPKKWYNIHGKEGLLKEILKTMVKKGAEIEFELDANKNVTGLKVIKEAPESGKWEDDIVSFETLLTAAHKKAKAEGAGLSIITTVIKDNGKPMIDIVNKTAFFKARVSLKDKDGKVIQSFDGHGDTTSENVKGEHIMPHFIRMAETRAIVRALRWYTNNGCAEEEK